MANYKELEKLIESEIDQRETQLLYYESKVKVFPRKDSLTQLISKKRNEISELNFLLLELNEDNLNDIKLRYNNLLKN